jgi:hypothetical protein
MSLLKTFEEDKKKFKSNIISLLYKKSLKAIESTKRNIGSDVIIKKEGNKKDA